MRIRHKFGLSSSDKHALRFLNKLNLVFQMDELTIVFEIFEDDNRFSLVNNYMKKSAAIDVVDAVYDQFELDNSAWLSLKSNWWSQYPQPEENMGYIYKTYDTSAYCPGIEKNYFCGNGLKQIHPFTIKKEPNWGTRNFMMLNWVPDELFVSARAYAILLNSSLTGFSFWDVFNKSQKPYNSIKQIHVDGYLSKGLDPGSIEQKYTCPICGFEKYTTKVGAIKFNKDVFVNLNCDIIKTTEKFGEIGCDSLILVSHAFYNTIVKSKIGRGLVFEPIELV